MRGWCNVREALDQTVLVCDFSSGIDVLLLCFFEFLGGGVFFEGYLESGMVSPEICNESVAGAREVLSGSVPGGVMRRYGRIGTYVQERHACGWVWIRGMSDSIGIKIWSGMVCPAKYVGSSQSCSCCSDLSVLNLR